MSNGTQPNLEPPYQMWLAILLTFLFGPLGVFYVSVLGGVVMTILTILFSIMTLGFGLPISWIASICVAAYIANNKNNQAIAIRLAHHSNAKGG